MIQVPDLPEVPGAIKDIFTPTIKLGVTGLANSGKTVFINALVHNLVHGDNLELLEAQTNERIKAVSVQKHPNKDISRFDYESNMKKIVEERVWPDSTYQISELRLIIEYVSKSFLSSKFGTNRLFIDIVDYPGEWLLDLPLLDKSYRQWCKDAIESSNHPSRSGLGESWKQTLNEVNPQDTYDPAVSQKLVAEFTNYLKECVEDPRAIYKLPPGRFLMPGDMAGKAAMIFTPLNCVPNERFEPDTIGALFEEHFEMYKKQVVEPFYENHFAKLDRQIVLVDALTALNSGPEATQDLEDALSEILKSYKPSRNSWLFSILTNRKIKKILIAATKTDHVFSTEHKKLENLVKRIVGGALIDSAAILDATIKTMAISSVRSTKEKEVKHEGKTLNAIIGIPMKGESVNGQVYDGEQQIALFPGKIPDNIDEQPDSNYSAKGSDSKRALQFVQFRPPKISQNKEDGKITIPHIRLDKAIEFLIGESMS